MRVETTINFIPEAPSASVWDVLNRFATEWNQSGGHALENISNVMLQLRISDSTPAEQTAVRALAERLRSEAHVTMYPASRRIYDEQDYRNAAFVEILGTALDRPGRPLVTNIEDALGPPSPCAVCGWQDIFNAPQTAPFEIDEALLDEPLLNGENKEGGWDCVAMPAGRLLVSRKLLAQLQEAQVVGIEVLPLIAGRTGRESEKAWQITAGKAVLVPSSDVPNLQFCQACGAVLDEPEEPGSDQIPFDPPPEFQVSHQKLGDDELLSRHPSRAVMLYFAQRACSIFMGPGVHGAIPTDVLRLS